MGPKLIYNDYLKAIASDEGRSRVLDVFFVSCQNCQLSRKDESSFVCKAAENPYTSLTADALQVERGSTKTTVQKIKYHLSGSPQFL